MGSREVRIEHGVLWIGRNAYPLHNISHVSSRSLRINKTEAVKTCLAALLGILLIGPIAAAVVLGLMSAFIDASWVISLIGFILVGIEILLVVVVIRTTIRELRAPEIHGLVLGTAGTETDAVWSTNPHEIAYLVREVSVATGRPRSAQLVYEVQNFVSGDVVNQYGDGNIGKARHSGSGNIGV